MNADWTNLIQSVAIIILGIANLIFTWTIHSLGQSVAERNTIPTEEGERYE